MAKLGEICEIKSGGTPSRSVTEYWNGGIPWVKISDFKSKYIDNTAETISDLGLEKSSAKLVESGSILFTIFATLGEVAILNINAATNQAIASLTLKKSDVDRHYLYYYLISKKKYINEIGRGVAQNNINMSILKDLEVPLPPLEVQHNLAENLDKATRLIDLCNAILEKLYLLVKARFVEMFGDPISNSMGWELRELGECLDSIDNGKSYVCESESRVGDAPAILKLSAVTYGIYRPDENKTMIDIDLFDESAEVKDHDLLFTRKNTPELVGMSAYVFTTPKHLMMPDLIFRLNTKNNCNKIYLWQLINHELFRPLIQSISNGSAKSMSNISKERLSSLIISLPPLALQEQFADFVKQTDKSKSAVKQVLEKAETLKKALMQKYFT